MLIAIATLLVALVASAIYIILITERLQIRKLLFTYLENISLFIKSIQANKKLSEEYFDMISINGIKLLGAALLYILPFTVMLCIFDNLRIPNHSALAMSSLPYLVAIMMPRR